MTTIIVDWESFVDVILNTEGLVTLLGLPTRPAVRQIFQWKVYCSAIRRIGVDRVMSKINNDTDPAQDSNHTISKMP